MKENPVSCAYGLIVLYLCLAHRNFWNLILPPLALPPPSHFVFPSSYSTSVEICFNYMPFESMCTNIYITLFTLYCVPFANKDKTFWNPDFPMILKWYYPCKYVISKENYTQFWRESIMCSLLNSIFNIKNFLKD